MSEIICNCATCKSNRLLEEFASLIARAEFSAEGYCPHCGGWEVEKGRGDKPKVHNATCPAQAALAKYNAFKESIK